MKSIYKLEYRFTVTRYEINESDPHPYPHNTNERLSIEDTFDLTSPMSLTQALATIDDIHIQIARNARAKQ